MRLIYMYAYYIHSGSTCSLGMRLRPVHLFEDFFLLQGVHQIVGIICICLSIIQVGCGDTEIWQHSIALSSPELHPALCEENCGSGTR